jgi:BASS family bile acid:Na+ symporter
MNAQQLVGLALQASVLMTVFGFGLRATLADVLYLTRRPWLLARSLGAMFVVMPLIAVMLTRIVHLLPSVAIAMIALAISPTPPLLPGKQGKAGGHASYAVGLMTIAGLLSIVVVPLGTQILGRALGQPFQISIGAVAQVVLVTTLLPLALGMGLAAGAPAFADRIAKPIAAVAGFLLAGGMLALLAAAFPAVMALIGNGTVLAIMAFVAAGLAVGHFAAGSQADNQIVLALSTASRHPAIALAVAKANFPDEPHLGAAVLLFLLVGGLVSAPYLAWQRRRSPGIIGPADHSPAGDVGSAPTSQPR